MRKALCVMLQADQIEQLGDARARRFGVALAEPEGNVLAHVQVGEQGVVLKHHPDPAPLRRGVMGGAADALPANGDLTAAQTFEAGDGAQHGGLAAARRAEQAADIAFGERETELIDDRVSVIGEGQLANIKQSHRKNPAAARKRECDPL